MTDPAFALRLNLADFEKQLDADADNFEAAARPAAQAAIQVFYDEIRRNVSKLRQHTGNLASSIYQVYSQDNSGQGYATYQASWNAKKAPHGHLVEFGHLQRFEVTYDPATKRFTTHKDRPLASPKQIAAKPFVRPAFAKAEQALDAAVQALLAKLEAEGVVS